MSYSVVSFLELFSFGRHSVFTSLPVFAFEGFESSSIVYVTDFDSEFVVLRMFVFGDAC